MNYTNQCKEWERTRDIRCELTAKIEATFEPRIITPPETAEVIEALVTCSGVKRILEVGMYSGFTSMHILRAIVGTETILTCIDCSPSFDREFFAQPALAPNFRFVEGRTPEIITSLVGQAFDFVFIDSDHSPEHNEMERLALMKVTRTGSIWLFHDIPEWRRPDEQFTSPGRAWVNGLVASGFMRGLAFPTCEQLDCVNMWGHGYPQQCAPHLGIFIRS
jgi:hypothetical protein